MLPRLIYITQGATPEEHLVNLQKAIDAGVTFVQLRLKDIDHLQLLETAKKAMQLCKANGVLFTINDYVDIAHELAADAVHVGLDDSSVAEVRQQLPRAIIGGTANTLEHIRQRAKEAVDYIGLGPFRFTTTKKKLSPVLGLEGYVQLINAMKQQGIQIPVYAIGGITANDIEDLLKTGVYGVAVSGAITNAADPRQIINLLNTSTHVEHRR